MPTKGICLIWSRGRLISPSLSCRGQGIGKHRGNISSWHKRTAGRNLVVHRHGTTLRHSVQRYRCWLFFFFFFNKKSQQTRYLETFQPVNRLMYSVPSQLYSSLQSGFLVERSHQVLLIRNKKWEGFLIHH